MARDSISADGGAVDLGRWAAFPISQVPRPVVLLGPPVQLGQGFVDGASKLAWLSGSVVADVPLPMGLLELATEGHSEQPAPTVLHISSFERCEGEFLCDRGLRTLSAYRLSGDGLRDGCIVLDPALECWWPRRAERSTLGFETRGGATCAQVEDDDRTIHFPTSGGPLTVFHHAEFVEYETCVVGRAITTRREVPPGTAVALVRKSKQLIGRLERPLAGRVLLNSRGHPVAVITNQADNS